MSGANMPIDSNVYDTVLLRDTCGHARTKVKNYFYYNIYDKNIFKYNSDYDELILLDVLEGSKSQMEYLKRLIPFLIFIAFGALSWILWIVMCYCTKKPKGCLKRYSRANKASRRVCFLTYFGFVAIILILIVISLIYLEFSKSDLNGTICTLGMLRYEMMYGESLLAKEDFKKPYWYGINFLSDDIGKVQGLLNQLTTTSCPGPTGVLGNLIDNTLTIPANKYHEPVKKFKKRLEDIYQHYKDEKISYPFPTGTNVETIPLYISNLGFKENNETYTGRILYDFQIHYEHLIGTITDPIIEICNDFNTANTDLIDALERFRIIISTLEDSMNVVTNYITSYLSKYLTNMKSFYFIFCFISFILMGSSLTILSIIFSIYYFKPFSALFSSIKAMLNIINFLMIFCLIFSGVTGIFSIYFANASDIVDCSYSTKNIGSDNPRIITRTTPSSVLTRCIRGDGNLLEEFLTDNAKKTIKNLKKINSIYIAIQDAYKRIKDENKNVYNSLVSLEQVIEDFKLMEEEFSLTTSLKENGKSDISLC